MPTIILSCKCVSAFQDYFYGLGNRVHNLCKRNNKVNDGARCTVCGAEHERPGVKTETKTEDK